MDESAIYLAEYADLRDEIHQRINNQLLVLGGNLVLIVGIVPAYDRLLRLGPIAFFVLTLAFAGASWIYFEQDIFVTHAATYLHRELRPAIVAQLTTADSTAPHGIFEWERFRNEALFRRASDRRLMSVMLAFRYLGTMGPGVGSLTLGLLNTHHRDFRDYGWISYSLLAGIGMTATLFIGFLARHVLDRYRQIAG